MSGLEGAHYSLVHREGLECSQCLVVCGADIFGAAGVLQICMFRSDGGIVESCGNGPCVCDLPLFVLKYIGFGAMEDTYTPSEERCTVFRALEPAAGRFHTD